MTHPHIEALQPILSPCSLNVVRRAHGFLFCSMAAGIQEGRAGKSLMPTRLSIGLICLLFLAAAGLAPASDPFYLGAWKIASAVVAPWSTPQLPPNRKQMLGLMGQPVTLAASHIEGPRELACRTPSYAVIATGAELLFQGMLEEMERNGEAGEAAKQAAGLGFSGKSWKTLDTGCANALQLHFLNPRKAAFALNNYVYFLERQ